MHVHSAIARLRDVGNPQPRAKSEVSGARRYQDAWLDSKEVQGLKDDLDRYGDGVGLADCEALSRLFADHRSARGFSIALIEGLAEELRWETLEEAPFRFQVSKGLTTLRILEAGNATINLVAYEPLETSREPDTALFADREAHEIVLSGQAEGWQLQRADDGPVTCHRRDWVQGDTITTKPIVGARQMIKVARSLLVLQLVREPATPKPTCLVRLSSGEVLQTASGDKPASQAIMALGVLGALGAETSCDTVRATALNRDEDAEVRWEATRQLLGLNAKAGMCLLGQLSQSPNDPLNAPARNLRTRLMAAQPDFAGAKTEAV
ncbi:MAG: hypothetical protein AAGB23_05455 [Pseudomonadota bacterium]